MIWRVIPFFQRYEVSEYGQVRRSLCEKKSYIGMSGHRAAPGVLLRPYTMKHGYFRYTLCDDNGKYVSMTAHHAVALGFCGPRPTKKHKALHWDDNPKHNHRLNIRWGSDKDNYNDAKRNGRIKIGSAHGASKLNEVLVADILRKSKLEGKLPRELGKEFGVSPDTIRQIVKRKTWRHVC